MHLGMLRATLCVAALLTGSAHATVIYQSPGTVELRMDDADGHDTYASTQYGVPTGDNKGNSESAWLGKAGDWRHNAYFRFDELSELPLPSQYVVSAELWLCVGKLEQPSSATDVVILGHRVLEGWTESGDGGMTGATQPAVSPASSFRSVETPSLGFRSYDATDLVKTWLAAPASNYGVRLSQEYDVDQTYYFVSSEASGPYPSWPYHGPENRPYLEITYLVPEGAGGLLLLAGCGILAARKRRAA